MIGHVMTRGPRPHDLIPRAPERESYRETSTYLGRYGGSDCGLWTFVKLVDGAFLVMWTELQTMRGTTLASPPRSRYLGPGLAHPPTADNQSERPQ